MRTTASCAVWVVTLVTSQLASQSPVTIERYSGELVTATQARLTPIIRSSVQQGSYPLVVQCTAAGSSALLQQPGLAQLADVAAKPNTVDLTQPYMRAHYEWDFGDNDTPSTGNTVGMNLAPLSYHTTDPVFVDIGRHMRPWVGSNGASSITTDALGNLTSIAPGAEAHSYIFPGRNSHPEGIYTVYYDGVGSLTWAGDATLVTQQQGKQRINVQGPLSGLVCKVTSVDVADPIKNIRIIMPGYEKSAKWQKQPFVPRFLERVSHNRVLRYMDWAKVNNSTQATWASRTTTGHATQDSQYGVALEYQIQLANTLKCDAWFCVPHLATQNYMVQMATLIRDTLDPGLTCYIEYSNECWNYGFSQAGYCNTQGAAIYSGSYPTQAARRASMYYSDQCALMWSTFTNVFGDTSRLNRVMAGQRGGWYQHGIKLQHNNAYQQCDSFAINCYFGNDLPSVPQQVVQGWSADDLMDWADQEVVLTLQACASSYNAVNAYSVPLVAYEGGQHILGYNSDMAIASIIDDANRSPRMYDAYRALLTGWEQLGGGMWMAFNSCMRWSNTGRWGVLEYQDQPRSEAPKYDALKGWAEERTNNMPLTYDGMTGEVVWSNRQVGPNATHVYRSPGTYTVTLTMSLVSTAGVEWSGQETMQVVVDDNLTTTYFDSVNGDDGNSGVSPTEALRSIASLNAALQDPVGGRRILLARGSEWVPTTTNQVTANNIRIGTYGVGPKPKFTCIGAGIPIRRWNTGTSPVVDFLLQGVVVDAGNLEVNAFACSGSGPRTGVHLVDCDFLNSIRSTVQVDNDGAQQVSIINCNIDHGMGLSQGLSIRMHAPGGVPMEYLTIMGTYITGGAGSYILDHAIYPSGYRYYDLFRWLRFGSPNGGGSFCINYNCAQDGFGLDNKYMLTAGCDITGWRHGIDQSSGGESVSELGRHRYHIIQGNAFHDYSSPHGDALFGSNVAELTIRDNIFYGLKNSITYQLKDPHLDVRVYRNKGYGELAGSNDRMWRMQGRMNKKTMNRDAPTVPVDVLGQRWYMFDNDWWLASGPSNSILEYLEGDMTSGNLRFADNYWSPVQSVPFQSTGGQDRTIQQWITTFPGCTSTMPLWRDPQNGYFMQ
jgi:PKD repeat protein